MNCRSVLFAVVTAFLAPTTLFAHHAEWMKGKPFIQGLSMPVHGLDHMLVTFAVGLIAVQIGGYALWAVPVAFSLLLLLGGVMNVSGIAVPFAEQGDLCVHHCARRRLGLPKTASATGGLGCGRILRDVPRCCVGRGGSAQRLVLRICGRLPNRCLGCFGHWNGRRTFAQAVKSDASHPVCWMGNDRSRCINCHLPELKQCGHSFFGVGPRQLPAVTKHRSVLSADDLATRIATNRSDGAFIWQRLPILASPPCLDFCST
jgi:hypothetical protein